MLPGSPSGAADAAAGPPNPCQSDGVLDRVVKHIFAAAMHLQDATGGSVDLALGELDAAVGEAYEVGLDTADGHIRSGIDCLPVPVVVLDSEVKCVEQNRAFSDLCALPPESTLGAAWLDVIHPDDHARVHDAFRRAADGSTVTSEWRMDGSTDRTVRARLARTDEGQVVVAFEETTGWRAREAALARRASLDPLTGLLNRAVLADRGTHALERYERTGRAPVVFFIDLDGFKAVNDRFGHQAGDRVLAAVADRMRSVARPSDTFARVGGDEFVMLCEDVSSRKQAIALARRLREAAAVPTELARGPVQVGVSVGIAVAESPLEGFDALLARADRALYEAKSSIGRIAVAPTSPAPDRPPDDGADARLQEAVQALSEAVGALPLSSDHDQHDWVSREVALHCIHRALLVVRDLAAFAPADGPPPATPPRASTGRPQAGRAPEPSTDGA